MTFCWMTPDVCPVALAKRPVPPVNAKSPVPIPVVKSSASNDDEVEFVAVRSREHTSTARMKDGWIGCVGRETDFTCVGEHTEMGCIT